MRAEERFIMIREVLESLVRLLRDNIADPDQDRANAGKNFIFPGWVREDAKMPRISIISVGTTEQERTLEGYSLFAMQYQIDVWVDTKRSFTINNEKYSGAKLRDYLADQVIKVLRKNRNFMENVVDVEIRNVQDFEEREFNLLRKSITITVKYLEVS